MDGDVLDPFAQFEQRNQVDFPPMEVVADLAGSAEVYQLRQSVDSSGVLYRKGVDPALRYRHEKLSIRHHPIVVTSPAIGSPNLYVLDADQHEQLSQLVGNRRRRAFQRELTFLWTDLGPRRKRVR